MNPTLEQTIGVLQIIAAICGGGIVVMLLFFAICRDRKCRGNNPPMFVDMNSQWTDDELEALFYKPKKK